MDSKVHVSLSNETILDTDLLVIAEGRNSTLAKSVASDNFSRDYQQIAKTFLVEIANMKRRWPFKCFMSKKFLH